MTGYQSILDRVGFLVSANVNALLKRALDANSLAVFDEYVERMYEALAALQTAEGRERGRATALARQSAQMQAEIVRLDQEIDWLLRRGERGLAAARQALFNTKAQILKQYEAQLAQCQQEVAKLAGSRANLKAEIELTQAKRLQLVGLIEQKRAAQLRGKALAVNRGLAPDHRRTDDAIAAAQSALDQEEGKAQALAEGSGPLGSDQLGAEEIQFQLELREARLLPAVEPAQLPAPEAAKPRRKRARAREESS